MPKRFQRAGALAAAAAALALLVPATMAGSTTVVQVNQTDLHSVSNPSGTWYPSTAGVGAATFVHGPAAPPLGAGSLQLQTTTPNDQIQLLGSRFTGRPLSDLTGLTYWTYRSHASTSPSYIAPAINIAIYTNASGPGTGFATLVFEPLYAYGNSAIHDDVWQRWDTFAPSQTTVAGGWWTTRQVGSCAAFTCYATLDQLKAQAPHATILGLGVDVGKGPASFIGNVDDLSVTMGDQTTTFDFELAGGKAACKRGAWAYVASPSFRNQGGCVSYFARQQGRHP